MDTLHSATLDEKNLHHFVLDLSNEWFEILEGYY